jgi:hypothetical protein
MDGRGKGQQRVVGTLDAGGNIGWIEDHALDDILVLCCKS